MLPRQYPGDEWNVTMVEGWRSPRVVSVKCGDGTSSSVGGAMTTGCSHGGVKHGPRGWAATCRSPGLGHAGNSPSGGRRLRTGSAEPPRPFKWCQAIHVSGNDCHRSAIWVWQFLPPPESATRLGYAIISAGRMVLGHIPDVMAMLVGTPVGLVRFKPAADGADPTQNGAGIPAAGSPQTNGRTACTGPAKGMPTYIHHPGGKGNQTCPSGIEGLQGEARPTHPARVSGPWRWRTRKDPFKGVWGDVLVWWQGEPETAGNALMARLQSEQPDRFTEAQPQIMRPNVKEWRGLMAKKLVYGATDEDSAGHNGLPKLAVVGADPKC